MVFSLTMATGFSTWSLPVRIAYPPHARTTFLHNTPSLFSSCRAQGFRLGLRESRHCRGSIDHVVRRCSSSATTRSSAQGRQGWQARPSPQTLTSHSEGGGAVPQQEAWASPRLLPPSPRTLYRDVPDTRAQLSLSHLALYLASHLASYTSPAIECQLYVVMLPML